jgi:hypothetical protein
MRRYETLKQQYPEYISLDQLHRICRIAKRSARYLVEHGIISAIDTGNKTWRWKIHIDDVIDYLRRRDKHGSMIPTGAANSKKDRNYATGSRRSFANLVEPGQEHMVVDYFVHLCAEYDDILTAFDIATITGLHKNSLQKLLNAGHIRSLASRPRYVIPKEYFLEFVGTKRFLEIHTGSEQFGTMLESFILWKQRL